MPSNLKHYKRRPKKITKRDWSGSGYYYMRGNRKWSKWTRKADLARGSKTKIGSPKRLAHTTDKKLKVKRRKTKKSR